MTRMVGHASLHRIIFVPSRTSLCVPKSLTNLTCLFMFWCQGLPAEVSAASMFNGEEELFAFARCCSRLVQMGSAEWMDHAGR
jgi:hypothetical protein